MPVMKVNKKYQITIPANVRKELNISAGDLLEAKVTRTKDGVVYKIKRMSDKEISEYWKMKSQEEGEHELSELGKQRVEEALLDVKEGRIKVFDNAKDLMKDLNE
ncbi:MAG: AbrB/MazE/SpoVT family DNA-binding domain-containing protein [Candidatus Poribacteria bacterium]